MKTQSAIRKISLWAVLCGFWLCSQCLVTLAQTTNGSPSGKFNLGQMSGVFTIEDFKVVSGISQAAGWLTGNVTDPSGTNQVGTFTNFAVRVPLSGLLSGNPVDLGIIEDPVTLPTLSTNTCDLLGVVVGEIDVILPGLGLDVHVNQISLIVRADRERTIGNLLCNVLSGGGILGLTNAMALSSPIQGGSSKNLLTVDQVRGLFGILLGSGLPGTITPAPPPTFEAASASSNASGNGSSGAADNAKVDLLQNFLQSVISTIQPVNALGPSPGGSTLPSRNGVQSAKSPPAN